MREQFLCLDVVLAAPFDDSHADGYVVECANCGWCSAVLPTRADIEASIEIAKSVISCRCRYTAYPVVGTTPPFIVRDPNSMVVWRCDAPGLEPRKIPLSQADFKQMYGRYE